VVKKFFCGLVAIGSFGVLLLAADDPFVGTWKLNVAKSKFTKGQDMKDTTTVIAREGDTVAVSFHATDGTGTKFSGKYTVSSAGGTPTYTEGGPPYGLTEKIKRIDDRTVDMFMSKDGKEVLTERFTVSPNHKTMIGRVSGVDEKGTPFKNVEVYDRQ
jgi:hypothetical protein